MAATQHCHPRLICNFDQIWCTLFRPNRKVLQKSATLRNVQNDDLARSLYMRQLRHSIEISLDLPISEPNPKDGQRKDAPSKPLVQGGAASSCMVDQWRQPRTLCSLSFVDGYVAKGYVTYKDGGGISQATRAEVNQKYGKYLYVAAPQAKSHIWSETSLIHYLDFLSQEVRLRRAMLGLSANDRCLCIMDQAGAHQSKTFEKLQKKFMEQHNIVTWFYDVLLYIHS